MSKKIFVTDTILRDAHQSLLATRMRTEDMLPICDKLDKVGYWSLECWGGATFDACVRFLKEDPWERLRQLRAALPNTRLQMLLRGQNLLGYRHYSAPVSGSTVADLATAGFTPEISQAAAYNSSPTPGSTRRFAAPSTPASPLTTASHPVAAKAFSTERKFPTP